MLDTLKVKKLLELLGKSEELLDISVPPFKVLEAIFSIDSICFMCLEAAEFYGHYKRKCFAYFSIFTAIFFSQSGNF